MAALAQDVLARYPLNAATRAFLDRAGPMFIDGQWLKSKSGRTIDVFDPATARVIAQVADADKADVDLAVRAARKALESPAWADMKPAGRELLLLKLADAIEKNFDELAELESLNVGKLLFFSRMIDIGVGQHDHGRLAA